jgi:hypothetical protein
MGPNPVNATKPEGEGRSQNSIWFPWEGLDVPSSWIEERYDIHWKVAIGRGTFAKVHQVCIVRILKLTLFRLLTEEHMRCPDYFVDLTSSYLLLK